MTEACNHGYRFPMVRALPLQHQKTTDSIYFKKIA